MKILYYLFLYFMHEAKCEDTPAKSKNPLPYIRRQIEEVIEDTITETTVADNLQSNLVSFFIKNINEIYNELYEGDHTEFSAKTISTVVDTPVISVTTADSFDSMTDNTDSSFEDNVIVSFENIINRVDFIHSKPLSFVRDISSNVTEVDSGNLVTPDNKDILKVYRNATLVPFSDKEVIDLNLSTIDYELSERNKLMHLSKNLILFETDRKIRGNVPPFVGSNAINISEAEFSLAYKTRSCIYCNNVALDNCNDPKHKLIPSTVCERDDDLCYSLHTPFGVIDRGCFSLNHNFTTYVCSCNLCNYISITEMPYTFSKKGDWIDNIVELSRTRQLRKSVFKEMSCLKCEANSSSTAGNMVDLANCLEGNIGYLPTEYCENNEVCAVRALRKDGYVWRGCLKFPLYNYWWNLCDNDLCNYDTLVSIYEP